MHPRFVRGELDVGNIPWKDPSFYKKCQLFSNRQKKKKKSKIFLFLLSMLCYHWKKQNPKSKCLFLLTFPFVSFTRAVISREPFESLGAKPESIPHALQTAGLKLLTGLSLYD